jgi:hypothetical protein
MEGYPAKKEEEPFREQNKIGDVLVGSRSVRYGDHRLRREQTRVDGQFDRSGIERAGRENG